jgi:phage terminase large subunit GpA-like protein
VTKEAKLLENRRALCGPPRKESILAWAERERNLAEGVSSIPGRFRALPYQRKPLDAITDRAYSEHVWMIASQTIKTESINCVIGYFMDAEPCGIMVVYPTLDGAKEYSKKKLSRMIRGTPCLRNKVRESRSRDSGNTLLSKEFPGGDLRISGSNSPASLRGSSRRVVIQDEIDSYEASAGSEGDPCALADTRAENFSNAIFIKASTPTIKGLSRIEEKFEESTKHRYFVPCPHCGQKQTLKWAQLRWEPDKPETAAYYCEKCDKPWTDADRIRAIYQGEWIAEFPGRKRFGAHLSGLYRLIGLKDTYKNFLHEFAAVFLDRKHAGEQSIKAWQNTFLAESYEEQAYRIAAEDVSNRCESYNDSPLPGGVLVITAGADVQKDRIELECVGWGIDEESWGLGKTVLVGDPEKDEVWSRLSEVLLRKFKTAGSIDLPIQRTFIDMQYKTPMVLRFCQKRITQGVYPCRGLSRTGLNLPPLLPARPSTNNKLRLPHWNIGVTIAKSTIYDRMKLPVPGARSMHFPEGYGYDEDHFRQLVSERVMVKYSYGQAYYVFEKDNQHVRNEALDIRVYAYAALQSLMPIGWARVAANIAQREKAIADRANPPPPQPERVFDLNPPAAPKPQKQAPIGVHMGPRTGFGGRKGFVKGWR